VPTNLDLGVGTRAAPVPSVSAPVRGTRAKTAPVPKRHPCQNSLSKIRSFYKMAKFLLGQRTDTVVVINKKSIQWSIDFTLPDKTRENMAVDEVRAIDGIFVMDFYSDPHVGDYLTHKGHRWRIIGREFVVTRHLKREPKSIPRLVVEYVEALTFSEDLL